jgi:hypothetical protein
MSGTMTTVQSILRTVWPPSLENPESGYKTKRTEYTGATITESLNDLHEHAWWTGLKIVVGGVDTNPEFLVTLFDSEGVLSTLRVRAGEAQPFQWALPANVTHDREIGLHIAPILSDPIPYVNVITYFHEMPPLHPLPSMIFICDDYSIAFQHGGAEGTLIIPTMLKLYQAT